MPCNQCIKMLHLSNFTSLSNDPNLIFSGGDIFLKNKTYDTPNIYWKLTTKVFFVQIVVQGTKKFFLSSKFHGQNNYLTVSPMYPLFSFSVFYFLSFLFLFNELHTIMLYLINHNKKTLYALNHANWFCCCNS